jgi:hypothetical protein
MQSERQLELSLGRQPAARRRPRKAVPVQAWRDAAVMPFLGGNVILRLDGERSRAELSGEILYLPLPPEAGEGQIRDRAEGWLQGEARRLLGERLALCAQRLGHAGARLATGLYGRHDGGGRCRRAFAPVVAPGAARAGGHRPAAAAANSNPCGCAPARATSGMLRLFQLELPLFRPPRRRRNKPATSCSARASSITG